MNRNFTILCIFFLLSACSGISGGEAIRARALQGSKEDIYLLGKMYHSGNKGVPRDCNEALKWFQKSAELGHPKGWHMLGFIYYFGECVPQDYIKAAKYYRKAAENGLPISQQTLGTMYLEGKGVAKDLIEAAAWLAIAAEKGAGSKNEDAIGKLSTEEKVEIMERTNLYKQRYVKPCC